MTRFRKIFTRLMVVMMGISNVFTPFTYAFEDGESFVVEESSSSEDSASEPEDTTSSDDEESQSDEQAESDEIEADETENSEEEENFENEENDAEADESESSDDEEKAESDGTESDSESNVTENEQSDTEQTINTENNSDKTTDNNGNTEESNNSSNGSNGGGGGSSNGGSSETSHENTAEQSSESEETGQTLTGDENTGMAIEMVEESIAQNMEEIETKRKAELDQAWEKLNPQEISQEETFKNIVVSAEAPEKSFPKGTEIRIELITDKKEIKELKNQLTKDKPEIKDSELSFFDISFIYKLSDGAEIKLQPKKPETVKVSFNYAHDDDTSIEMKMYYLYEVEDNENNNDEKTYDIGKVEIDKSESSDEELVVKLDKSSIYSLAIKQQSNQTQTNNEVEINEENVQQPNPEENTQQPDSEENVVSQPVVEVEDCAEHYHRNGSTCTKDTYTITWKNEDGSVRDTTEVEYGEVPSHADAFQPSDAHYTYEFKGWTPEFTEVTADVEYVATYTYVVNKYTVTWENEDGTTLEKDTGVEYGTVPTYNGSTPSKAGTAEYSYVFKGWSPVISEVKGNITYKANYTEKKNTYTITWKNEDGSVRDTTEVEYGKTPTHADANQPSDAHFTYEFKGWSPEITEVNGNAEYTATYTYLVNKYTVTWKNEDGATLEKDTEVEYGTMPSYDGATPTKQSDGEYDYIFRGWNTEISEVKGDVVYTATYYAKQIVVENNISSGTENVGSNNEDNTPINSSADTDVISGALEGQEENETQVGKNMKDLRGTGDNTVISILTGTNTEESIEQTENNEPTDSQSNEPVSSETTLTEQNSENITNENADGENSDNSDNNISYGNISSGTDSEQSTEQTENNISTGYGQCSSDSIEGQEVLSGDIEEVSPFELIQNLLERSAEEIEAIRAAELATAWETLNTGSIIGQETYKNIVVNVQAPAGTFPEGAELRISPITTKNEIKEIKEQIVDSQDDVVEEPELIAFDIAFIYTLSDGTEVELQPKENTVQVTFDYSNNNTFKNAEADDSQTIEVYHINDKNEDGEKVEKGEETVEKIEINQTASAEVDNGLVIDAEKFSTYTIVVQRAEQTDPNTGDPKTWTRGVDYFTINIPRPEGQTGPEGFTIMDRNLGADAYMGEEGKTAEDWYGYYYQRGNNYGFATTGNVATTTTSATYDAATMAHSGYYGTSFYATSSSDYWDDDGKYDELWGGENDASGNNRGLNTISTTAGNRQGPCPSGWHVPSAGEWNKVIEYWVSDYTASGGEVSLGTNDGFIAINNDAAIRAFLNYFKLPSAGYRFYQNANPSNVSWAASYWLSTTAPNNGGGNHQARYFSTYLSETSRHLNIGSNLRTFGFSVRCFKNVYEAPVVVYTVSFDTGTGTITVDSQEIESGSTASQPITQLTGYTAIWYLDSGFVTPFDFDTPITGDITLYAKWHKNRGIEDQMPGFTWGEISISRPESISTGPESYIIMDRNLGATSSGTVCDTGSNNGICGLLYQYGNNYGFSYGSINMAEKCNEKSVDLRDYSPSNPYYDSTFVYGKKKCNNAGTDADWAAISNYNIWGGQNGNYTDRQGPCPNGWHIPTKKEWEDVVNYWTVGESDQGKGVLNSSNIDNFRNYFQLPLAGERTRSDGIISHVGSQGSYDTTQTNNGAPYILRITTTGGVVNTLAAYNQVNGYSVRCFKNIDEDHYTVTFEDWDGNELWSTRVAPGETPVYSGNDPTRPATEESVYTFTGWYPELYPATHDETYTAVYTESPRIYTVTFTGTPAGYGTLSPDSLSKEYGTAIVISGNQLKIGGEKVTLTGNEGYEFQEWTGTCGKAEKYVCDEEIVYKHSAPIEFTGGNNVIIPYYLFSESNYQKDFEISFDIVNQDMSNAVDQAAILNVKDEDQDQVWPGIVLRRPSGKNNANKLEFVARGNVGKPVTISYPDISDIHNVKISRINSVVYISVNGGDNRQVFDYSGSNTHFDKPIVFGSSYKDGNPLFRPAKVTLSNIMVKTVDTSSCYTGNVYVVTGDCQMTARFIAPNEYEVTIASNNAEYGSVSSGSVTKPCGTTIVTNENTLNIGGTIVTATTGSAPTGHTYTFSGWIFSNECGSEGNYAVAEGCAITGNFEDEINEYEVRIASNNTTYGTVDSGSVTKPYGTSISVIGNTLSIGGTIVTATTGSAVGHTYTFSGWTLSNECGSEGNYTVAEGCAITGNFKDEINEYEVTIASNNNSYGTVDSGSVTKPYGTSISVIGNTLSIGGTIVTATTGSAVGHTYTFSGWTLSNECGSEGNYTVAEGCAITGNFKDEINEYEVTWKNWNNATLATGMVTHGDHPVYTGADPKRSREDPAESEYDFIFTGWRKNGDSQIIKDLNIEIVTGNVTYTAQFDQVYRNYIVKYNANGGSGTMLDQDLQLHTSGALATNTFKKLGYNFAGWISQSGGVSYADGQEINLSINDVESSILNDDLFLNLQAQWTPKTDTEFTVNCYVRELDADHGTLMREPTFLTGIVYEGKTDSGINVVDYRWKCAESGYDIGHELSGAIIYGSDLSGGVETGWEGSTTILADESRVINMYIVPKKVLYTANPGENCVNKGTMSDNYYYGTKIRLEASPYECYSFSGWIGESLPSTLNETLAVTEFYMPNARVTTTPTVRENRYNIIFSGNGSTSGTMSNLSVLCTSGTLSPNTFEREGYTFAGWSTTSTGTVEFNDKSEVYRLNTEDNGSVTLYAVWDINNYEVTGSVATGQENMGYLSGESTTGSSLTGLYEYGRELIFVAVPELGYLFDYWEVNNGTGDNLPEGVTASGNQLTVIVDQILDIVAHFTENVKIVRVNYYAMNTGGTYLGVEPSRITFTGLVGETKYAEIDVPEGFYLDTGTTTNTGIVISENTEENIINIYYVRNKYYISLGYTGAFVNPNSVEVTPTPIESGYYYGESVHFEAIVNTGYVFKQWRVNGVPVAGGADGVDFSIGTEDINLVVDGDLITYNIDYYTDPGYSDPMHENPHTYTVLSGEVEIYNPIAGSCYEFLGWTGGTTGDWISIPRTGLVIDSTIGGDREYYANWERKSYEVTLSVDPSSGGTVTGAGIYRCMGTIELHATPNTGYHFVGWYDNIGNLVSDNSMYVFYAPEGDLGTGLTAKFEINQYYVSIDKVGSGGFQPESAPSGWYNHGTEITVKASPAYGYKLQKWSKDGHDVTGENDELYTGFNLSLVVTKTGYITVYYEPETYNIIYMDGDSILSGLTPSTYTVENHVYSGDLPTITKNGYTFEGWFTEYPRQQYNRVQEIGEVPVNGESVTIYAGWTPVDYYIHYHLLDGETIQEYYDTGYTIETSGTLLPTLVEKSGYEFSGWVDYSGKSFTGYGGGMTGNLDLYPTWKSAVMNIEVHYYEMDTDGNYSYMYDTLPYTGLTESTFYVPDYSKSGFHLDRSRHSSGNPSIVVSGNESANIIDVYYERERYYLETSGRSYQIPGSGMIYFVGISPDKQPYYQYYYGEEITLEYLHPYGWNFSGWYDATPEGKGFPPEEMSLDSRNFTFHMPAHNVLVEPIMEHIPYILSFTGYEGAEVINLEYCNYGTGDRVVYFDHSTCLPNLSKEGYWFNGWDDENGNWVRRYSEFSPEPILYSMPDRDYKLTANFSPKDDMSYEERYYLQNIEGTGYSLSGSEWQNDGVTNQPIPVRYSEIPGFDFPRYWIDGQDLPYDSLGPVINATGDNFINYYYDRLTYLIDVDYDSSKMSITGTGYYRYDAPVTLTATVKTGYQFSGFSSEVSEYNTTEYTLSFNVPYDFVSGYPSIIQAYAKPIEYSIEYELNGGDYNPYSNYQTGYTVEDYNIYVSDPIKTGYDFLGWTGGVKGERELTEPTTGLVITGGSIGNRKYYANWEPAEVNVTVNYYLKNLDAENNVLTGGSTPYVLGVTFTGLTDDIVNILTKYGTGINGYQYSKSIIYGSDLSGGVETGTSRVLADGSREIDIYYIPKKYDFTLNDALNSSTEGSSESTGYYYGANVTLSGNSSNDCFIWSGWNTSGITLSDSTLNQTGFTMPANNVTVTPSVREKTYNIIFSGNGSTSGDMFAMNGVRCTESTGLTLNNFGKIGYHFTGWSTTSTGTRIYTDGQSISGLSMVDGENINLYAVWDANDVSVHIFHLSETLSGGTLELESGSVLTKVGSFYSGEVKTFPGFTYNPLDSRNITGIIASWDGSQNGILLYYTRNEYPVTITNDGEGTTSETTGGRVYLYEEPATISVRPFTGWEFVNWTVNEGDLSGVDLSGTTLSFNMPAEAVEISPNLNHIEYTVTFDAGSGTTVVSQNYYYNDVMSGLDSAITTREGYTFSGWYLSGVLYTSGSRMPAENITLTAKWRKHEVYGPFYTSKGNGFKIVLYADDGKIDKKVTLAENPGYTEAQLLSVIGNDLEHTSVEIIDIEDLGGETLFLKFPKGEGYSTKGFCSNQGCSYFATSGSNEVTATFKAEAMDVANVEGPSWAITANNYIKYNEVGRSGYVVLVNEGDVDGYVYVPIKKYTVTWKNSNGSGLEIDENVKYGETPSYDGDTPTSGESAQYRYTWIGWSPEVSLVTGNVTYTAKYTPVLRQYTVRFLSETGYVLSSSGYYYGTLAADIESPAAPAKVGYTFGGWSPIIIDVTGDAEYTATYTINEYTVTFDAGSGTTVASQNYNYDEVMSGLDSAVTTREGYTFSGWYLSGVLYTTGSRMPAGDITLVAQWIKDKFGYRVEYYYDGVLSGSKTEIGTGEFASQITGYTDKNIDGYVLSGTEHLPLTITSNSGNNVIEVYYNKRTDLSYIVRYLSGDLALHADKIVTGQTMASTVVETAEMIPGYTVDQVVKSLILDWTGNEIKFNYTPNDDTPYTVLHKLENLAGTGYDLVDTDNLTGETATIVTPAVKTYNGFTSPAVQTGIISGDGSLVITYLYSRKSYTLTFKADDTIIQSESLKYEAPVTAPSTKNISKPYYHFLRWDTEVPATMPSNDLTINVVREENGRSGRGGISRKEGEHGSAEEETGNNTQSITGDNTIDSEVLSAYEWARMYDITTMDTIEEANPNGLLLRGHLAKIAVNYAVNVLGKEMPTKIPTRCNWGDDESVWESEEIKDYAEKACALGVMGLYVEDFLPNKVVSRAEFGTVLSRLLWGDAYNVIDTNNMPYYELHLKALKDASIMTQIDNPLRRKELREWVWVMLRRARVRGEREEDLDLDEEDLT